MMLLTLPARSQSLTTSDERAWSVRSTQCRDASYARAAESASVREDGVGTTALPMHTVSTAGTVAIIPHHRGPHYQHLAATPPAIVPSAAREPTASKTRSAAEGGCRCQRLERSVWVSCSHIRREGTIRVKHDSSLPCECGACLLSCAA